MDKVMVRTFFLMSMCLTFLAGVIAVSILLSLPVIDTQLVQVLLTLLIFTLSILFIGMWGYLQLTKPQKQDVPYWMRNGMEDVMAPNVDMRVMLQNMRVYKENLDYFLDRAELDLENQANMVGQIRGGTYDKDQPRAPRPPSDSTRGNGDSR